MRLGDDGGELAQRLRHEPRLQADVRVAHLALDLGLGHQGGHRVDDDDVDGVRLRTSISAISSACSPLSGCETSRLSMSTPSFLRVLGVERVLGVDEGGDAAALLGLGDDRAAPASSCPTTPGRRPRRRGRAGKPPTPSA